MRKVLLFLFFSLTPILVFAAPTDFKGVIDLFLGLINAVIPLLGSLAVLVFLWGIAKFIYNAGDTKSHEDGKMMMVWGLLALFVMVSYVAIIRAANQDVGFGGTFGQPQINIKNQ